MAIGDNKGQWSFADNVRLTFKAGENLVYEDRVSLQADGKTVVKDPDGPYQVFFPKTVESGKAVEVLEIIKVGGGGSGGGSGVVSGVISGNDLVLTKSDSSTVVIDISAAFDDTNLSRVVSGQVVGNDLVLTRDDSSTFNIDVTNLLPREKYRGELSALTDTLPTTDVQAGDHWFITEEGSNFGNIEGVNTLSRGDLLFYLNLTGDNDRSNPQNWQGIQQNTNDAFVGFVSLEDIPQVVDLVANTPLSINAVVLATGAVRHVTLLDSSGNDITSGVSINISGTTVILESNVNLTDVVVNMAGVA